MHRNIFIVLVLLLVVAAVWYFIQPQQTTIEDMAQVDTPKTTEAVSPTVTEEIEQPNVDEDTQAKSQPVITDTSDELFDSTMRLLEEQRYSIDPYVELQSIVAESAYCNDTVIDLRYKDVDITEQRTQLLEQNKERCNKLKSKYPFLNDLHSLKIVGRKIKAQPSATELGDMYREENDQAAIIADFSGYFSRLTEAGIKAKNAQVLVQNSSLMNQPFFKPDKKVGEILGGLDEDYIRLVQQNTYSLISCEYQGGISCLPDSQIMVEKCMQKEAYCGMNFLDWYQQYTTEAQKRDVEKLMAHYQGNITQ
jgi:hypothetical protein